MIDIDMNKFFGAFSCVFQEKIFTKKFKRYFWHFYLNTKRSQGFGVSSMESGGLTREILNEINPQKTQGVKKGDKQRSKVLEGSGYQDQVFVEIVKLPCGEIVKPIEERMTPRRAIRMYCVYCNGWKVGEVKNCIDTECLLYPHRFGFDRKKADMTALKLIRKYCVEECCAGEHVVEDIKNCQAIGCPFLQYRFGHNPKRKGIGGKGNIDALKKWRE